MKRIYNSDLKCMMAIDGEYEMELGLCNNYIKDWQKRFFKKNASKKTTISLRCAHNAPQPEFWLYYLELSRDNKNVEKHRICEEAYDVLANGKSCETFSGIDFVTLHEFKPVTKST